MILYLTYVTAIVDLDDLKTPVKNIFDSLDSAVQNIIDVQDICAYQY